MTRPAPRPPADIRVTPRASGRERGAIDDEQGNRSPSGLVNLGHTCFINSIAQCILANVSLIALTSATIENALTHAPLGYFYNAPHWGGGGLFKTPLLTPKLLVRFSKFKDRVIALANLSTEKQILMTSGSPMTLQVRTNTKCLTFPCNAFPLQNADNKLISSL